MIAPASTGRDRRRRMTVIFTAQVNKGIMVKSSFGDRMFIIVVMKFRAPRIEDAPAR